MYFPNFHIGTTMASDIVLYAEAIDCGTTSGPEANKPCIFPFTSHGITYNACTTDQIEPGDDTAWCSTMVDNMGLHVTGKWGNCEAKCPKDSKLILFRIFWFILYEDNLCKHVKMCFISTWKFR